MARPANLTNEYENSDGVTRATTEVIDGVEYEVVYLTGDPNYNINTISEHDDENKNYCYVLTADWDARYVAGGRLSNVANLRGKSVVFDLNGYTYYANGWERIDGQSRFSYLVPCCDTFELTDSSAAQSGQLAGRGHHIHLGSVSKLIISGGSGLLGIVATGNVVVDIVFKGGRYDTINFNYLITKTSVSVAPYLIATYDAGGRPNSAKPYDAYAVSTTNLVSGAYNYAYGLAWEIPVAELRELSIPTDRTYYLWGRDKDGWYQYLGARYVDGAWTA